MRRALGALILAALSGSAPAATFTVNTLADENDGTGAGGVSLRDAINAANAAGGTDTINFSVAGTITLTNGQLPAITSSIQISGPGIASLTIDAQSLSRIFFIDGGISTISGVWMRNGLARGGNGGNGSANTGGGGGAAGMGGGIFINSGTLTLSDAYVSECVAQGGNGGSTQGGVFATGGAGGGGTGASAASVVNAGPPTAGGTGDSIGADGVGGTGGAAGASGLDGGAFGGGGGGCGEVGFGTASGGGGGFGAGGGGAANVESGSTTGGAGGSFGGNGGGNSTASGGGGGGGLGGAIFLRRGLLTLSNDLFTTNSALRGNGGTGGFNGGPGQGKGGAVFIHSGAGVIDYGGHTYSANQADDAGVLATDNADVYGSFALPVGVSKTSLQ